MVSVVNGTWHGSIEEDHLKAGFAPVLRLTASAQGPNKAHLSPAREKLIEMY